MSRSGRTNHSAGRHVSPYIKPRVGGGAEPYTPSIHVTEIPLQSSRPQAFGKKDRKRYLVGIGDVEERSGRIHLTPNFLADRVAVEPWTPSSSDGGGNVEGHLVPSGRVAPARNSQPTKRSRKAQPSKPAIGYELNLPEIDDSLSQLEGQILLMEERLTAKLDTLYGRSQAVLFGQPALTEKPLTAKGSVTSQLNSRLVALCNRLTALESDLVARIDEIHDASQTP